MKKTYIAPEMVLIVVETNNMVCTSLTKGGAASTNGITSADSRRGSFWDDEDDY